MAELKELTPAIWNKLTHRDIIQTCIDELEARTYLEIGVSKGSCFAQITAPFKVGVDPIPAENLTWSALNENARYYQTTSDKFFEEFARDKFPDVTFDAVFVDGLHEFNQAYRDIENALAHLSPKGVIIVHDCTPINEKCADPNVVWDGVSAWTGDVWKAIVKTRSLRKDAHVFTLNCDWGCGVITKGEPESTLSFTAEEIDALKYSDFAANAMNFVNLKHPGYLNVFLRYFGGAFDRAKNMREHIDRVIGDGMSVEIEF